MKFMLLPMTSKCFCGCDWLRSACRMSATCWVAPKYTSPSMRSSLSCGHSSKAWRGGSSAPFAASAASVVWSITTNCRSSPRLSKPMLRMAGREVRYKKDISDKIMPSKIAVSSHGDRGQHGDQCHRKIAAAQGEQLAPARKVEQRQRDQHQQGGQRGHGNLRQ